MAPRLWRPELDIQQRDQRIDGSLPLTGPQGAHRRQVREDGMIGNIDDVAPAEHAKLALAFRDRDVEHPLEGEVLCRRLHINADDVFPRHERDVARPKTMDLVGDSNDQLARGQRQEAHGRWVVYGEATKRAQSAGREGTPRRACSSLPPAKRPSRHRAQANPTCRWQTPIRSQ